MIAGADGLDSGQGERSAARTAAATDGLPQWGVPALPAECCSAVVRVEQECGQRGDAMINGLFFDK